MEDSQALISPDTHKLGDGQKPIKEITHSKGIKKNREYTA